MGNFKTNKITWKFEFFKFLPKSKKFSEKLVKMSEENDIQNSSLSENSSDDDESKEAGPSVAVNPFFDKSKRQKLKSEKSENSEKDSDSDFSDSSDDEDSDLSEKEDSDAEKFPEPE